MRGAAATLPVPSSSSGWGRGSAAAGRRAVGVSGAAGGSGAPLTGPAEAARRAWAVPGCGAARAVASLGFGSCGGSWPGELSPLAAPGWLRGARRGPAAVAVLGLPGHLCPVPLTGSQQNRTAAFPQHLALEFHSITPAAVFAAGNTCGLIVSNLCKRGGGWCYSGERG